MTLGRLILRNVVRRPVRLALTVCGLAMVVVAVGLIRLTLDEWQAAARGAHHNRLITVHAMSERLRLPLAYAGRLAAMPGVRRLHYGNYFGGVYRDPKESFGSFAEQATTLFATYPELVIAEAQQRAFQQDRRGCIIGQALAQRFGWKIGDAITLTGTAYPGEWELVVRGIFRSNNPHLMGEGELYLHWAYANERLKATDPDRADQVGWFVVVPAADADARRVAAEIDAGFANSFAETRTEPEQAYIAGWVARSGTLLRGLEGLAMVINGIAVLVLLNALALAMRERTREYAVMKVLGYHARHFWGLVVGESILIALCGGALGLTLLLPAARLYAYMTQANGVIAPYALTSETVALCLGIMVAVGILAGLWPALRVTRMTALLGLRHAGE